MEIYKKYLITSGCSFTEGHNLRGVTWADFLAKELNLDLVNLGKGGTGNKVITQMVIDYCTLKPEIAKKSYFVIQLSECLRYLINYDNLEEERSMYWHFTPNQFIREDGFENWDLDFSLNKHIYDNRYGLAPFFSNITFSLLNTYWDIINIVNFFENNNYPYLIFDGLNNHIPIKINGKWCLREDIFGQNRDARYELDVSYESDLYDFIKNKQEPVIHYSLIEHIKSLKYYYNDEILFNFCHFRENEDYYRGNDGHPNELGAKMWAKHLKGVIENYD